MHTSHKAILNSLALAALLCVCSARGEQAPYVSPGIGFAWNIGGGLVISPKISIGIAGDGRFVNLTVGMASCSADDIYPQYFVECQYGVISRALEIRKTLPLCGGGAGFAISPTDKGTMVVPRVSAFVGFLLFVNLDVLLAERTRANIGGELALPIPLKRIDFGRLGG
jgi:hypothetical protein